MNWFACGCAMGAALAMAGPAFAAEPGQPLSACGGAVGAWLTDNPGKEPSRSLLTLTADGLVLFADSGQGGGAGFSSFTSGHGAWRCVAGSDGPEISAIILDFTLPSVDWPNQKIGRLDITATVDAAKGTMSGTMTLLSAPLDGDPLASAGLEDDAAGQFDAARITAP
jgi:hypothetical protein